MAEKTADLSAATLNLIDTAPAGEVFVSAVSVAELAGLARKCEAQILLAPATVVIGARTILSAFTDWSMPKQTRLSALLKKLRRARLGKIGKIRQSERSEGILSQHRIQSPA